MRKACRFSLSVIVTLLTFAGIRQVHAGTIRHDRDDSQYRSLADEPGFQAVGLLNWREAGQGFSASGTLIDDEWVLTAAHVIQGNDLQGNGISNLTFRVAGRTVSGAEWFTHPDWANSGGDIFAGADIGLVRLSSPVSSVTPPDFFSTDNELGQIATIVGFGSTGDGFTGVAPGSSGIKRAGRNVIDVVGPPVFGNDRMLAIDFDNPSSSLDSTFGSSSPLDLEFLATPGDSGGGVFLDVDGQPQLTGVVSFISTSDGIVDGDYGDRSGFTRVSKFLSWIESTIGPRLIVGDFDSDGLLNEADIDLLSAAIRNGGLDLSFDLNADGQVNVEDRREWIEDVKQTRFGDANLDLRVDGSDFALWNQNRFEAVGWSQGDFDGDGVADVSDFNIWNANQGFAARSLVPEPSGWMLAIWGIAIGARLNAIKRRFDRNPAIDMGT